ncbi:putative glutamate synthase [Diplonema papillatum]|nr:putative glutamate synthase [Diplonema papillatum]
MKAQEGLTGFPVPQGLYHPENERDACGIGMIISIKGIPTRKTMDDASVAVMCMAHRGAEGSEPSSGDGAGITTAVPHDLIKEDVRQFAIRLPSAGHYAVGNVFLSKDGIVRTECKQLFENVCKTCKLEVLGWRKVPVDPKGAGLGPSALSREPVIQQVLVTYVSENKDDQGVDSSMDLLDFERRCYIAAKTAANQLPYHKNFYFCSLNTRTIVYKGMLTPGQLFPYFSDLQNKEYKTHFAVTHTRFSTNTFPSWDRAQPLRYLAHNGEINTLMGNTNWMRAREGLMESSTIDSDTLQGMYPVIDQNGSDSSALDNVIEFLLANGEHTLPEIMMLVAPEAWENDPNILPEKRGFYEWGSMIMEPWDGPALFAFCDGRYAGAILDRNGLRPARYWLTTDDYLIMGSECGLVPIPDANIKAKGRLQPGKMLLVDMERHTFIADEELKQVVCTRRPYSRWVAAEKILLSDITSYIHDVSIPHFDIGTDPRMRCMGYTKEQVDMLITPMAENAYEALGSMGNDAPLACLSDQPRLLYDYFKQLFAQVTNPPIDPFREAVVMSLKNPIGPCGNLLQPQQEQCARLELETPVISLKACRAIKAMNKINTMRFVQWKTITLDICFPKSLGAKGLEVTLRRLQDQVVQAIDKGFRFAVLSDRNMSKDMIPVSSLVALGCVHQHLVREKRRMQIGLIVETAEAREVHHMAVLLGYGADAICPYLVFEMLEQLRREGKMKPGLSLDQLSGNYIQACDTGIRKVMSKMGISTLKSYRGAQVFEAVGIHPSMIQRCFAGTSSRIKGIGLERIAVDCMKMHCAGWPDRLVAQAPVLPDRGEYHYRAGGERHMNDPGAIAHVQNAARTNNRVAFKEFLRISDEQSKHCTIRGLFGLKSIKKISIDEVEPASEIVKRFVTGAMSYGSISKEAHESLAIAMNRMGGKSNTGEGGEDPGRFAKMDNGDSKRSSIKQVASGRFGVTIHYLTEADEIQIKMAQGAKPGEGGELPGHKVTESIAECRMSTQGVGLISPPPHHDIYSIEDLKQLIYDLKCANPTARISVKLVSKVGVGVIASGVAKGFGEHITISGHDGGTGAASWTGIKHAGLPWELGIAETHQTLVLNDLRGRVVLQTDGQLKTGRDVVVASLLGADEFGFSTTPLVTLGCIMMRKCHLNTCPVGIATQDPELRKKFTGQPEHVINYFFMLAEEIREIMGGMGFRTMKEMCGRADMLYVDKNSLNDKTKELDLSGMLVPAFELRSDAATQCIQKQEFGLETRLDNKLVKDFFAESIASGKPASVDLPICNLDRDVGTTLSSEICKKHGPNGLPPDTCRIMLRGSAGQSLGAFLINGVTMEIEGDTNDYVGKGLSGGKIIVRPPQHGIGFKSEENIVVGNVCLYGATSGTVFIRGVAAERFCVRNSGAIAVVEGVGDHGCEYMTGGRVVVLGSTGKNFGAGMSGGIAYIWDPQQKFDKFCNKSIVDLSSVTNKDETAWLRSIITEFNEATASDVARNILSNWSTHVLEFVKVLPRDYARAVASKKKKLSAPSAPVPASSLADIEDVVAETKKTGGKSLDKRRGFLKYPRKAEPQRDPKERLQDDLEISLRHDPANLKVQAARCMDCGVPFCSSQHSGCPISNVIPKFNDLTFKGQMREAFEVLMMTNNFPEFTGRVCPAPCEGACTLGIHSPAVSIKSIEAAIIDTAFENGWVQPRKVISSTSKIITIIGSGPAGLAAADQLNKAGHTVTVYERAEKVGGLLMYGIPNMKLDKAIVQRRIDLMAREGIHFVTNCEVGVNVDAKLLLRNSHAFLLTTGATWPRDLQIKGRDLNGIHFAMDYLSSMVDGHPPHKINASGKNVIVIGGGDTGNDCIGTSMRQGAKSVVSFEIMPQPPADRADDNPWPQWPKIFRVDYGHEEVKTMQGDDPRQFNTMSKEFVGKDGCVTGIRTIQVEWTQKAGKWSLREVPGTEKEYLCDLVFLAMGFLGPERGLLEQLEVKIDGRGNITTSKDKYHTNIARVYTAGDCRRGQSLVVWAINEGRQAARQIDNDLMFETTLPLAGGLVKPTTEVPTMHTQLNSRM